jgi:DNA polymerase-3 subunit delta
LALLTRAAVRQQIASGSPDPLYVVMGEDDVEKAALASDFAGMVEEDLQPFNVERVHAGEMTTGERLAAGVAALVSAARTLPMMSSRRVVIVMQADALLVPKRESEAATRALDELERLITAPEPLTVVVLVVGALDKRTRLYKLLLRHATIVDCGAPEDLAAAVRWVQHRVAASGVKIEASAARTLASLAGFPERERPDGMTGDVKRLRGDVERLMLYTLGEPSITAQDVRELVGPAALQDDWAMTNAIEAGQTGEALRQLALLLDDGAPSEKVLGQLGWVVRAKFPGLGAAALRPAVEAVFQTDLDLKRSAGDPRILLERLIVELCTRRGARGGAPRRSS